MSKVAIVTDSAACLPKEQVEKYGIFVVPMRIVVGDQVYHDGKDITPGEIYNMQRKSKLLPTTSAPSPQEFLEVYRQASQKADVILNISLSSKLSMLFDSANQAMEEARSEFPGTEMRALDSQTAAGAQAFMVLAAARLAAEGRSLAQILKAIEELSQKIHSFVAVDTLRFLTRGGRVPKVTAWAGSLLSIKTILQIDRGEAIPIEKTRTRPLAIKRLVEIMEEKAGLNRLHINLMHANAWEEAQKLKRQITTRFDCAELHVTEFSSVMGVHTGPGLVGLAFHNEEDS